MCKLKEGNGDARVRVGMKFSACVAHGSSYIQGNILIFSVYVLQVSIQFNETNVRPGTPVSLQVTADEGSMVKVLAVDKSVILMADGNDITPKRVR